MISLYTPLMRPIIICSRNVYGADTFPFVVITFSFAWFQHTSRYASRYMNQVGINWWRTPPESPDLNPIEMVWHHMKDFLRARVKPTTKEELVRGIHRYWEEKVTVDFCRRYIRHLNTVVPKVMECRGGPSGH